MRNLRAGIGAALLLLILGLDAGPPSLAQDKAQKKIDKLEKKLSEAKTFDRRLHLQLLQRYLPIDQRKAMENGEEILKHKSFDAGVKRLLTAAATPETTATEFRAWAAKYSNLPHLKATLLVWAAESEKELTAARQSYQEAQAVEGISQELRDNIDDRKNFDLRLQQPWPVKIIPPRDLTKAPGPWSDPDNPTVWPNTSSRANSDPWIAANHDTIRVMKPRILVVNWSNEHTLQQVNSHVRQHIKALAESSRYHGYENPRAPAFLQYQIFKIVDLRDKDRTVSDSRLMPGKPTGKKRSEMKYRQWFSSDFAAHFGVPDPRDLNRYLRLDELIDGGYVHEVWMTVSGNENRDPYVSTYEVVEEKPKYDASFKRIGKEWVQAGNGGDDQQPWTGRSVRINSINLSRGIGCSMENLGHGMEQMAASGCLPYFTKYFNEYADVNLKRRYGLPFDNLYAVKYDDQEISYPNRTTAVITHDGKKFRVENYIPVAGSVHFPPNARNHYDLENSVPVMCTMKSWRINRGTDGKDKAEPYTRDAIRNYGDLAPDCMGPWLIYWRQNMPGLDNKQKDDDGKPMKNWWPFLFY